MRKFNKISEIPQDLLIEQIIKNKKKEIMLVFKRLYNEPFKEYMEHIREEVEYRIIEEVKSGCDKKFGKRKTDWRDF